MNWAGASELGPRLATMRMSSRAVSAAHAWNMSRPSWDHPWLARNADEAPWFKQMITTGSGARYRCPLLPEDAVVYLHTLASASGCGADAGCRIPTQELCRTGRVRSFLDVCLLARVAQSS
jgi:hypothetical protein